MQTNPQTERIVILSLFDGMGCGAIALANLGVNFKYYASEVDKFAVMQTKHNFPNAIHLGDVRNVDVLQLPKIDIIMGGSPCQSFSFAGKQKGMVTTTEIKITTLAHYLELKAAGFEFEGQSYLFWEYMRILEDVRKINPDVEFLLENVEMAKHWEGILSRAIGVYPVHINSNLVSAQNRPRVYWTNFQTKTMGLFGEVVTDIPQPADRKIFLKDILQPESEVAEKYYLSDKAIAGFTAHTARHKAKGDGFEFAPFEDFNVKGRCTTQKEGTRTTSNFLKYPNNRIRRLTPTEAARLQTVPPWYKWIASDTQIYKMCGNGWTVAKIEYLLTFSKTIKNHLK